MKLDADDIAEHTRQLEDESETLTVILDEGDGVFRPDAAEIIMAEGVIIRSRSGRQNHNRNTG